MNRYLAVYSVPSGIATIENVGVVDAEDEAAAKRYAAKMFGVAQQYASDIYVHGLDDLEDGWAYYV